MSSADEQEKLAQFRSLTGAPEQIARSYLEASSWDIETAAETFFESTYGDTAMQDQSPAAQDDDEEEDESWQPQSLSQPATTSMPPGQRSRAPAGRFATLGDYGSKDDDDEDEGRQNMFAGGEKSGISIQNPGQKAQDEVRSILGRAVQAPMPVSPDPRPQHFGGTGYTLGSEATPSQAIGQPQSQQQRQGPTRRQLTLWRNGFTVDDGPLYAYSDPESLEILREIRMGRLPRNIAGVQLGEDVEMQVHKRENEDWTPGITGQGRGRGSAASGAFVGRGNRLGSAIPGEPVAPAAPPPQSTPSQPTESKPAQPEPSIDPSLPQTTIQLRLADGTRLVTQFNLSSTMEDMYSFVSRARPTEGREFVLQTIFPTRILERGPKTVEQEGLQSGTVVMRWKA